MVDLLTLFRIRVLRCDTRPLGVLFKEIPQNPRYPDYRLIIQNNYINAN